VFGFLKRAIVLLLALLLVAIFIWVAGPWVEIRDYAPLGSETARLIAIGIVVLCWFGAVALRWLRARRASAQLAGAVLQQAPAPREQVAPEAAKLRERFEEAVATLAKGSRDGRTLYDLPWYIIIGAPGSGKTTALVNSGLRFPLEQRVGKAAVRGIGGTRNCDWWFTEDAVFLDTAGRYTTQDSDPESDSEGWKEFLALLTKYRKRRPINGVLLTLSAQDVMTQGEAGREAHVEAAHRRIRELSDQLRIQLPVYLLVTKCDVVAGFSDYFEDQAVEGRGQVWGVTFPYAQSVDGTAASAYPAEFDALMQRLNARVFPRVEETRGERQRAAVFAFPQQMAALREPITEFVSEVFGRTQRDGRILLRGVYFTSGTQDGTQIDRLLGALGRRFGMAPEAVAPPAGRGKAYFVERLLREVIVGESGLAGVNRRLESASAVRQFAGYAVVALMLALGVAVLSASYAANRAYVGDVGEDAARLRSARTAASSGSAEALLPRLNAVRAALDSADRYRDGIPWRMRWGLFQGKSLANTARDTYLRELDAQLLPRFASRLRQRIIVSASDPELLFEYLKGYLMLAEPAHLDKAHLQRLADQEWKTPGAQGPTLADHFASLLALRDELRPMGIDQQLVAQARTSIRDTSVPQIIYGRLQRSYSGDAARSLRLDRDAAIGIDQVLRRKSGKSLSEPIPSLYRRDVFKEITGANMAVVVAQFAKDSWVWSPNRFDPVALNDRVTEIYERDYIRAWDALLADLEIVPFATVPQYARALTILTSPTSPLRMVLQTAAAETALVAAPGETQAAPPSVVDRLRNAGQDLLAAGKRAVGRPVLPPGKAVTDHFQPIQRLVAGKPAPIDGVLDLVRKLRDQIERVGPQVGGTGSLAVLSDPALLGLWQSLRQEAQNLPPPIDSLIGGIGALGGSTVQGDATRELERRYATEVVGPCHARVDGRYPFSASALGMDLTDFGDVFGYGGVFDVFFTTNLDKLVDSSTRPWTWRPESVHPSERILAQFERASRLRQLFFPAGSKVPKLSFVIGLSQLDLGAKRFYVDLAGQNVAIKPGEQNARQIEWPGSQGKFGVDAVFEDEIAAPVYAHTLRDPWAWFRFVDLTMEGPQPAGDLLTALWVQTPQHRARITIQAPNAGANPFGNREWRRFTCEA
jgi:type VI secretion system protein ImpL